jgi:hypothetical protein
MSRIPDSYKTAEWRNTLPVDSSICRLGIGLDLEDGRIERFSISIKSAKHLAESIQEYLVSHSVKSSGIPNVPGSTPFEGEKV